MGIADRHRTYISTYPPTNWRQKVGRIDAVISDELEKKLRMKAVQDFGGKKGSLTTALERAIILWVGATPPERRQKTRGENRSVSIGS